jgi:hypothetical protein
LSILPPWARKSPKIGEVLATFKNRQLVERPAHLAA